MLSHEEFERLVFDAMQSLPRWVHDALENIEVLVLDEADTDLDPAGAELLGLYVGLPLTERGADYAAELPDVIYVFRAPHLALGLGPDELRDEVTRTLVHEIAHYFGFDDERIEQLGWG